MKRTRKSPPFSIDKSKNINFSPNHKIKTFSINHLPNPILTQIFITLPVKYIVFCKSVCKKWNILISTPHFTKSHFAQAKPQFLLRTLDSTRTSRTLFLIDIDENNSNGCSYSPNSKLKIPIRNAQILLRNKNNRRLELKPKYHNYKIVNSCKGLLCLSEHSHNDPVAVANPVTGEFIKLPQTCNELKERSFVDCGLGFSPKSKKFKVVRVLTTKKAVIAEVHTLGTKSWRNVSDYNNVPYSFKKKLAFPTYLNGALYAFCMNNMESDCIVSFIFDSERFEPVPLPPQWESKRRNVMSLGVLGDELCLCDTSCVETTKIWVMKDDLFGMNKSWVQLFNNIGTIDWPCCGLLCQPLNLFQNGALLMFCNSMQGWFYYDQKNIKDMYVGIHGLKSRYEAIVYTPSFISLKNIVVGGSVEILNVNSRCGKLKLQGETKTLSLVEHDHKDMGNFHCSSKEVEEKYWTKHFWSK